MYYKDIYSKEFLGKFGTYGEKIGNLEAESEFSVDIDKLLEAYNIKSLETVSIDKYKERYLKAENLGYEILHHRNIINKYKDSKYIGTIKNMLKCNLNSFSSELILPKTILNKAFLSTLKDLNYDINDNFDESDIEIITKSVSDKTEVPIAIVEQKFNQYKVFI